MRDVEVEQALLRQGASVNARTTGGIVNPHNGRTSVAATALDLAQNNGSDVLIQCLTNAGAIESDNPRSQTRTGMSKWKWAEQQREWDPSQRD